MNSRAINYIIAGFILLVPTVVMAQIFPDKLVPCDGPDCDACKLVELTNNILKFLVAFSVFAAVIAFTWAGILMVTAAGNEGQITKAKNTFSVVAIGLIIVLASWLIVDTVLKFTVLGGVDGATGMICGKGAVPEQPTSPTSPTTGGPITGSCTDCVAITNLPIKTDGVGACAGSEGCLIESDLNNRLVNLNNNLNQENIDWRITEAWPPTRTHQNPCHNSATCVDANFTPAGSSAPTPENINTFIAAADESNLRAVYEVSDSTQKNTLVSQGVPEENVAVVRDVVPHFSVYKQ